MKKECKVTREMKLQAIAELGVSIKLLLNDISILLEYVRTLHDARFEIIMHMSDDVDITNTIIGYDKKLNKIESKLKLVTFKDE